MTDTDHSVYFSWSAVVQSQKTDTWHVDYHRPGYVVPTSNPCWHVTPRSLAPHNGPHPDYPSGTLILWPEDQPLPDGWAYVLDPAYRRHKIGGEPVTWLRWLLKEYAPEDWALLDADSQAHVNMLLGRPNRGNA